ncbi:HNH endonuclease [Salmonella enterica]|nr:HNH endonuclease [Salmonella enterica]
MSLNKTNMTPPPDELRDHIYYEDGKIYRVDTGARLGYLTKRGYYNYTFKGRTYLLHRLIFWLHKSEWPEFVDHKNGDHSDNRIDNLRASTRSQNNFNCKPRYSNLTGYTGVVKQGKKYTAQINYEGNRLNVCGYESPEAAAVARDLLSHWFFKEFTRFGILDKAKLNVGGVAI